MRPFNKDGKWGSKSRTVNGQKIPTTNWSDQTKAEEWRPAWADIVNGTLEHNNHTKRIDKRSYERQGVEQIPTIHLGAGASQMERRGIRTECGDINREIQVTNQKLRELKARLVKLQDWVKEEAANTEPPTLADLIQGILLRREQSGQFSRYQTIGNLKAAANILVFLQENKIFDVAGFNKKITAMIGRQFDIRDKLKPVERRLKILDERIYGRPTFTRNTRAKKR